MGTRAGDKGAHEDCIATWGCREMSQKSRLTVSAWRSGGEGVGDTLSYWSEQHVQVITALKRAAGEKVIQTGCGKDWIWGPFYSPTIMKKLINYSDFFLITISITECSFSL